MLLNELNKGLTKAAAAPENERLQAARALNLELLMETLAVTDIVDDNLLLPGVFAVLGSQVGLVFGDGSDESSEDLHTELFLSIELSGQVCQQIIEKNSRANLKEIRALATSSKAEDLLSQAESALKASVEAHLSAYEVDRQDPFNQFLMVVDSSVKDEGEDPESSSQLERVQRAL